MKPIHTKAITAISIFSLLLLSVLLLNDAKPIELKESEIHNNKNNKPVKMEIGLHLFKLI